MRELLFRLFSDKTEAEAFRHRACRVEFFCPARHCLILQFGLCEIAAVQLALADVVHDMVAGIGAALAVYDAGIARLVLGEAEVFKLLFSRDPPPKPL